MPGWFDLVSQDLVYLRDAMRNAKSDRCGSEADVIGSR